MNEDTRFEQRLRSAFAATSPDDAPTAECPPAEEIWDAVVEELDPARMRWVIAHVAACSVCTESWRLASAIARDGAGRAAGARTPAAPGRRLRWAGWASAVAAGLGFALISLTASWTLPGGSMARSSGADLPVLTLIQPEEPGSPSECRPRWTEFEGATYNVRVLTERFELLTERSGLTEPRFPIPMDLIAGLPAGSELRIHIEVKRGLAGVVANGTFDLHCVR